MATIVPNCFPKPSQENLDRPSSPGLDDNPRRLLDIANNTISRRLMNA